MFNARDEIINLFKKVIFPYKYNVFKTKEKEELEKELDKNKFSKDIENKSEGINYDLFEKHFNNLVPTVLAKKLFEIKNKNKNIKFVDVIKSEIIDLKNKIEKMSKEEKKMKNKMK